MTTSSIIPIDPARVEAEVRAGETRPRERPAEPAILEHEYDGIREYDNPMPRWWVLSFWATFVFSIGYFFHYHLSGNGPSVAASYAEDERLAQMAKSQRALGEAPSEAALSTLMADAALMASAKEDFSKRCAACHLQDGQGLIGPNLTDGHWLHGRGSLMDIYRVVSDGVPAKGMPAWQAQLSAQEVRRVVAFVGTLRGKNLPGKAPEGQPGSP